MKERRALKEIIAVLRDLGFKARHANLSRTVSDRLIHVITVQSGVRSREGQFTIEMGILFPWVYKLEWDEERPRYPSSPHCQFRSRLSDFMAQEDTWWDSEDPQTVSALSPVLRAEVPRYFTKWGDASAILKNWKEGLVSGYGQNNREIAALLHDAGREDEAEQLLIQTIRDCHGTRADPSVPLRFGRKLGLNLPELTDPIYRARGD